MLKFKSYFIPHSGDLSRELLTTCQYVWQIAEKHGSFPFGPGFTGVAVAGTNGGNYPVPALSL